MRRNRISTLNQLLRPTGIQLHHDPKDSILTKLIDLAELARMKPKNDTWTELALADVASRLSLRRIIEAYKIDTVVDVGANEGQFATVLREIDYQGLIFSIEPGRQAFEQLNKNRPPNSTQVNLQCLAGSSCGEAAYTPTKGSEFSSIHKPTEFGRKLFGDWINGSEAEIHPIKTIDQILDEHSPPKKANILIKSDTQGHEFEVLTGASQTLKRAKAVLVEYSMLPIYENASSGKEIAEFLTGAGFHMVGLYPITFVPGAHALLEGDALFVRSD